MHHSNHRPPALPGSRAKLWLKQANERLASFEGMARDWDSYGAEPISTQATSRAKKLLGSLEKELGKDAEPFAIAPLPDGGVQIEWRTTARDLEVEVRADSFAYLVVDKTGPDKAYREADGLDDDHIRGVIKGLIRE